MRLRVYIVRADGQRVVIRQRSYGSAGDTGEPAPASPAFPPCRCHRCAAAEVVRA